MLAVAYVALYGWLLVSTNALPYVYDNTETFSALWHAQNLYRFDFFKNWGLTDEAYGPSDPRIRSCTATRAASRAYSPS